MTDGKPIDAGAEYAAEIYRIARPHVSRALDDIQAEGVRPEEAAQAVLMLTLGALASAMGPSGAGMALEELAEITAAWMRTEAKKLRAQMHRRN